MVPMTSANKLITKADVDWELLARFEGAGVLKGYVPGSGEGQGHSGVTVATGVDVGQMSNLDFFRAQGIPAETLAKLQPYVGLKGDAAFKALSHRPLHITREEAALLDAAAFRMCVEPYEAYYNRAVKAANKEAPILAELDKRIATILISLCWNFGGGWGKRFPASNHFAVVQNWLALARELWHWSGVGRTDEMINNRKPEYQIRRGLLLRRREEAKYLGSAINAGVDSISQPPPRAVLVSKNATIQNAYRARGRRR